MKTGNLTWTKDGSHTLFNEKTGEHYHSIFGAVQESKHIFIRAGLMAVTPIPRVLRVLEVGFGTGLNALLTLLWSGKEEQPVHYTGIEPFPLSLTVVRKLNYPVLLQTDRLLLEKLHQAKKSQPVTPFFTLDLLPETFQLFEAPDNYFHVVYFDAFSPDSQPEMWTEEGFRKLFRMLVPHGILVTYSCKGRVKRALKSAGFQIEKLPGPPGKREFLRAFARK
jgi:tRNA U34 5-methylaminomethyl-2-thiouridine-forming methyltransferase MnmC